MNLTAIVIVALVLYLTACASPEMTRTRGGGPGADPGNRGKIVRLHEGARPFEKTPKLIPAKHPSLDPANQAEQLSRR
ncbi:MAG TPA: hypothetical protein VGK65_18175 [Candidatus Binatia bacterium]